MTKNFSPYNNSKSESIVKELLTGNQRYDITFWGITDNLSIDTINFLK